MGIAPPPGRPPARPTLAPPEASPRRCGVGRTGGKIENETFNALETSGYQLEHDFGQGKKAFASVFVVLDLLAFACHTVARLRVIAWRNARATCGVRYRFFEHLRTMAAYIVLDEWPHLLHTIIDPKAQAP